MPGIGIAWELISPGSALPGNWSPGGEDGGRQCSSYAWSRAWQPLLLHGTYVDSVHVWELPSHPRGCPGSTCIRPVWLERCKLSLSHSLIGQAGGNRCNLHHSSILPVCQTVFLPAASCGQHGLLKLMQPRSGFLNLN